MKTRLFLLLLCCFSLPTFGQQQILFQSSQNKSWMLSYISSGEESQRYLNEMLTAIATYIPEPVQQTRITLNVEESIKITRDRTKVSIFVTHKSVSLTGDIFYKAFDMSDVLVPGKYELAGTLSRNNGATFVAEFIQPRTAYKYPNSELLFNYEDSTAATDYHFALTSTSFFYDATALNRFREKVTLIDQYYAADLDLNGINEQLKSINPDIFEMLEQNQEALNNAKQIYDNVSGAAFWQALHIENYDPLKLHSKMYDLHVRLDDLQNRLNHTRSIVHQLYYNKGLELYNKKKYTDARESFEKSLSYNAAYAPSQYFLARIAYDEKKIDEAKRQIIKLFTFKNIDSDTYNSAVSLAGAIEWYDMNIAADKLNSGLFQEALASLDRAYSFCNSIPNYSCNDTIELIRGDCHRGIYADEVRKAHEALLLKKLDEAETYIDKAINYQRQFSRYIPDNLEALALKEQIKIEQYYVAMSKGKEKMQQKDYRTAFNEFKKASGIESLYPVKKDKQLPTLLKQSKLEVMLMDLDDAERLVRANDLNKAREILKTAVEEQKQYLLIDNKNLSQKIEDLKKSIFTQECNNAQRDYDNKLAAASDAISNKKFIDAEAFYTEALQIVERNRDCGISNELAMKGKAKVELPAQYQRLYAICDDHVRSVRYGQAIDAYNKLTAYYNDNNIMSSGLDHQTLPLYIIRFGSGFVLFGIDWFISHNELDNGYFLLKELRLRNQPKKTTKLQQQNLGRALAIRDYQANPGVDPKVKVLDYTIGDKWYSYFRKVYIKQVKKLN